MKKLLLLIVLFGARSLVAHTWHVYNHTNDTLNVKLNVIAGSDKNLEIAPNGKSDVNVGGYCLKGVEARGVAGKTSVDKKSCQGKEFHVYKQGNQYTSELR